MSRIAFGRLILIAATALVILLYYVPLGHFDYADEWREGSYGFRLKQFSPTVEEVSNPKLLRDGIRPGDQLEMRPFSADNSLAQFPRSGDQRSFQFITKSGRKVEFLTAYQPAPFTAWQRLAGILAILPGTVFFIVAFMLVFARPNTMTWMFFIFAVGYFGTKPATAYYANLPAPAYVAMSFLFVTLFGNFATLPLIQFVLRFPNNDLGGWRGRINPFVWAFLIVSFGAYVWQWFDFAQGHAASRSPLLDLVLQTYLPISAFVISALIMVKNFKLAPPEIRQRIFWLLGGMIVSFVAYAVYFVPKFISPDTAQVVGFATVLMPISVAYAVFRHRVIDVNFAINRAIVFAALSVLLVALVSLLDWGLGRLLGGAHLATAIEGAITIGFGFALNRLHKTFEGWVDRFLFWRRHRAEAFLRRVAAALPFATSEDAITDGLVHEPAEALDLAGAALYRRDQDSADFVFVNAHRASPMFGQFDSNHNLVRFLQAQEDAVWLDELGAHMDGGLNMFVVAVPILIRHQVVAFTLYAAHRNGAQIDPDEVSLLQELAIDAARAYDHVEAVRARAQIDRMQRQLATFQNEALN
ncbi:MAG: hypothetical protein M3N19_11405 [Candidatus Eremiobacteraeota bacterium]|nr:hypothetical protein [Candidatus Eremiobacteraeota bacterium]